MDAQPYLKKKGSEGRGIFSPETQDREGSKLRGKALLRTESHRKKKRKIQRKGPNLKWRGHQVASSILDYRREITLLKKKVTKRESFKQKKNKILSLGGLTYQRGKKTAKAFSKRGTSTSTRRGLKEGLVQENEVSYWRKSDEKGGRRRQKGQANEETDRRRWRGSPRLAERNRR